MGVPSPSSFEDPTQTNLKLATASTDTTPPTTTLQVSSVPIQGTNNSTWTFEGTASDNVGGKVGGVEISYDGGATWKRAVSGTPTRFLDWEYSVVLPSTPTPFVLTRAIDDSFNMEAVKAVHDGGTTLYVYGGSADNTIFIEKSVVTGGAFTFTVKNNTNTIGTFESTSATVNNIVVQLAIGQNSITLSDLNFPASGGNATLPGSLTIGGGIGKDTIILDRIKINGGLFIKGDTGADRVDLTNSTIVQGPADIDLRLNGNGSAGSVPIGATVNVRDSYVLQGTANINTGTAHDQVTILSMIVSGAPQVMTRGGNDRIDRGTAQPSWPNIQGGDGDDSYVYSTNNMPDTVIEAADRGRDTFDFSSSVAAISFTLPANFENLRGGSGNDFLYGNAQNNVLEGNAGVDRLEGFGGHDTYTYAGSPSSWGADTIIEGLGGGADLLDYSAATAFVDITLPNPLDIEIENLAGSAFNDILRGNGLDNMIYGIAGRDEVHGFAGNDTFIAGGNDVFTTEPVTFDGGAGANKVEVRSKSVYLSATATGGTLDTEVSNGAKLQANNLRQNRLTIKDPGSRVTIKANGTNSGVSVLTSLSVSNRGTLDLMDNDLIVNATATTRATVFAEISSWLRSGYDNASMNGTGMMSSAARDNALLDTGIGFVDNSIFGLETFSGQAVDENSILIKYTYVGDIGLNGQVEADDVTIFGNNFGALAGRFWGHGDFDYDGDVDADDLTPIANNLGKGTAGSGTPQL
jgi:Ca2+-binding RTX toxin-like protein